MGRQHCALVPQLQSPGKIIRPRTGKHGSNSSKTLIAYSNCCSGPNVVRHPSRPANRTRCQLIFACAVVPFDVALFRQRVLPAAAVLGGGLVILGSSLPWIASGRTKYSAFSGARIARELNVLQGTGQRWAVIALLLTPVFVPLGFIFLTVGMRRIGAFALFLVGGLGVAAGALVARVSGEVLSGPIVSLIGGSIATISSLLLIVLRNKRVDIRPGQLVSPNSP